jgi:hypothetical protein
MAYQLIVWYELYKIIVNAIITSYQNMKTIIFLASVLISTNCYSQKLKIDQRPDSVKEDYMDAYQASQISKVDLLSVLDDLGVRIFKCQLLPKFTKTYQLSVTLDEFVNGKKVESKEISPDANNLYFYWEQNKQYTDYISKIKFVAKDVDSADLVTVDIMGNTIGGIKLMKQKKRIHQFYTWRAFSVINWELNKQVPMLIYSSSWYDKRFNIERSCGAVDLSKDKAATKDLIDNSPHYFMISYKITQ